MISNCSEVLDNFNDEIREVVEIQKSEKREAIFFIFEEGFTEGPYKGSHTSINLSKDEERRLTRMGNIIGSVHTHPTGMQPSTIDIVTGLASGQNTMCIATPVDDTPPNDYVLTCMKFDSLSVPKQRQVLHAMRRSSMGVTNIGRMLRREFNFKRFNLDQCRVKADK